MLFVGLRSKISRATSSFIVGLLILLLIGCVSIFTYDESWYGFLKDFIYFLRPITVLLAAYFTVVNLKEKRAFFDLLVLTGFGFAGIHLLEIAINIVSIGPDISKLRGEYGRTNHVEMIALFIVICIKNIPIKKTRYKIVYQVFVVCLFVSFILYFSRTMFLVLFLMVLAYKGFLKLNGRGIVALILLAILGGIAMFFINQYEPKTEDPGILGAFALKIKNSYTEAFKPIDIDPTKNDKRELWDHWRAFEANLVYDKIEDEKAWVLGAGFGSTVDVGFEIRLQGEFIRYLPTTHNGLAYVYLKTGILGLLLYLFLIATLYLYYYSKRDSEGEISYNNLLAACAFYMFISSVVVTGIFKPYDMVTLLIGGTFALKQHFYFEDRNIRNEGDT